MNKLVANYTLLQRLNSGATAVVYRASPPAAVKIVPAARVSPAVVREVAVHASLDHPNIARLLGVAAIPPDSPENTASLAIITELLPRGDILDRLARQRTVLPIHDVRKIIADVAAALSYLADRHVVHGDVKLENVVIAADGTAKLIDFGSCRHVHSRRPPVVHSIAGTAQYLAPELLRVTPTAYSDVAHSCVFENGHRGHDHEKFSCLAISSSNAPCLPVATHATDAWAFGVMIYTMLTATYPFDHDPPASSASSVSSFSFSSTASLSLPYAEDTIESMDDFAIEATPDCESFHPSLEDEPLPATYARNAILHREPTPLCSQIPADIRDIVYGLLTKSSTKRMTIQQVCAIVNKWTPEMFGESPGVPRRQQAMARPYQSSTGVSTVAAHTDHYDITTNRQTIEEMIFVATAILEQKSMSRRQYDSYDVMSNRQAFVTE